MTPPFDIPKDQPEETAEGGNFVQLFDSSSPPQLSQVGGKGFSLIRMSQHGLPVPPGFVLTTVFFESWLQTIQQTREWTLVQEALQQASGRLKQHTDDLKHACQLLQLDDQQEAALAQALTALPVTPNYQLWAVRSSSPEEDLEGASFAGGYETTLGVTTSGLEAAIRRSFASCLDQRVFLYKREHGFDVQQPAIAVVVQQQITADTAGVAFSLNPLNNSYDEAVINANYGLGESVVSGQVSPDTYVVDKTSQTIVERKLGKKEAAIWLKPDGGTYEEPGQMSQAFCLTDVQIQTLLAMLTRIEAYYSAPVDIEWAFSGGRLHLLQARPVTAYFPLPDALRTAPGEPKQLYLDLTLTKWGMHEPLSVMGTDYLRLMNHGMIQFTMGPNIDADMVKQVRQTVEGRTYLVLSNSMKLQGGKKRVAAELQTMDGPTAEIIRNLDEQEYIPAKTPPALKGAVLKMIRQNLGVGWHAMQASRKPEQYRLRNQQAVAKLHGDLEALTNRSHSVQAFAQAALDTMFAYMDSAMPILIAAELARMRIHGIFKHAEPEIKELEKRLERGLPDNVTIEMGLAMHRLSQFEEVRQCESADQFATKLNQRVFTPAFLKAWDEFNTSYGFRGPGEMDVAALRFQEQPEQIFARLKMLAEQTDPRQQPQAVFEAAKAERQRAYRLLLAEARRRGRRKARRFEKAYQLFVRLGGHRETPKYQLSLVTNLVRQRILDEGRRLHERNRLDRLEQVFDLTLADLDRGVADVNADLKAIADKNTRFLKRLRQVRSLPRVVDSRGKILRAPRRPAGKDEIVGDAISPGRVQGRVKVLLHPDEKPVLPGEILVTRATDPGWTPLFLNAAGIVLEVGGALQHGALVAREYGKPCVAGIEEVTALLKDGQMVELDGTNGIVRVIPEAVDAGVQSEKKGYSTARQAAVTNEFMG